MVTNAFYVNECQFAKINAFRASVLIIKHNIKEILKHKVLEEYAYLMMKEVVGELTLPQQRLFIPPVSQLPKPASQWE